VDSLESHKPHVVEEASAPSALDIHTHATGRPFIKLLASTVGASSEVFHLPVVHTFNLSHKDTPLYSTPQRDTETRLKSTESPWVS